MRCIIVSSSGPLLRPEEWLRNRLSQMMMSPIDQRTSRTNRSDLGQREDLAQDRGRLVERAIGDPDREPAVGIEHLLLRVGMLDHRRMAHGGREGVDRLQDLEDVVADVVGADLVAIAAAVQQLGAGQLVLGGELLCRP